MVNLVGARIERKEDKKFLTGKGRYTADINLANQTYAYFVRSPHARAKIVGINCAKAMKAPGVVEIFYPLFSLSLLQLNLPCPFSLYF